MFPSRQYDQERLSEAEYENSLLEEQLASAKLHIAELEGDLREARALLEAVREQRDAYRSALEERKAR